MTKRQLVVHPKERGADKRTMNEEVDRGELSLQLVGARCAQRETRCKSRVQATGAIMTPIRRASAPII